MTEREIVANAAASLEEIQQGWHELKAQVGQLDAERKALEQEIKALRLLLERVIEHRQKSHSELVLLLSTLVGKLPINDVGGIVSRLVEHNTHVSQTLAMLVKGTADVPLPQPAVLQTLEQTRRDLLAALKPLAAELLALDTPLEGDLLRALPEKPERFFSPEAVRATRCFIKGQVPRERVVREYGEAALVFFNDLTTDAKLNPHPKAEEIVLGFKNEFESLSGQAAVLPAAKQQELTALYQRVQRSKAGTEPARAQRIAFERLSFIIELLHFYEHQNTEAPDVWFAQRLPALVEQLVLGGPQDGLEEKLIGLAEGLLAYVISPEHRQMIVNNIGKGDGTGKTLKYVLRLRAEKGPETDQVIAEFVRHLIPPGQKTPAPEPVAAVLRLLGPEMQRQMVKSILRYDRIRKEEAEALGRALASALGLTGLVEELKAQEAVPPETERQMAWAKIKDLLARRGDPPTVAAAIRDRLHAKYEAVEIETKLGDSDGDRSHVAYPHLLPVALPLGWQNRSHRPDGPGELCHPVDPREVRRHLPQSGQQFARHVQGQAGQPDTAEFPGAGEMDQPGGSRAAVQGHRDAGGVAREAVADLRFTVYAPVGRRSVDRQS